MDIIRGIILLLPGDHPPGKTTIKILLNDLLTFVVVLVGRILKLIFFIVCLFLLSFMVTVHCFYEKITKFFNDHSEDCRPKPDTKLNSSRFLLKYGKKIPCCRASVQ